VLGIVRIMHTLRIRLTHALLGCAAIAVAACTSVTGPLPDARPTIEVLPGEVLVRNETPTTLYVELYPTSWLVSLRVGTCVAPACEGLAPGASRRFANPVVEAQATVYWWQAERKGFGPAVPTLLRQEVVQLLRP